MRFWTLFYPFFDPKSSKNHMFFLSKCDFGQFFIQILNPNRPKTICFLFQNEFQCFQNLPTRSHAPNPLFFVPTPFADAVCGHHQSISKLHTQLPLGIFLGRSQSVAIKNCFLNQTFISQKCYIYVFGKFRIMVERRTRANTLATIPLLIFMEIRSLEKYNN